MLLLPLWWQFRRRAFPLDPLCILLFICIFYTYAYRWNVTRRNAREIRHCSLNTCMHFALMLFVIEKKVVIIGHCHGLCPNDGARGAVVQQLSSSSRLYLCLLDDSFDRKYSLLVDTFPRLHATIVSRYLAKCSPIYVRRTSMSSMLGGRKGGYQRPSKLESIMQLHKDFTTAT